MNVAYIDNQNLFMATRSAPEPWDVDMRRFRVYLRERYDVGKAYLFMGAYDSGLENLYIAFEEFGYILVFREHGLEMKGQKKGNVDVDIVFSMMHDLYTDVQMDKAILVSGDGDYFRTVEHFILMGKFEKILLPSHKNASSLYKKLTDEYRVYLDSDGARTKFGRRDR